MTQIPFWAHQEQTIRKLDTTPILFDTSDPGTGKTRSHLESFRKIRKNGGGPALVLATKSILKSAWGNDIDRYFPGMTYSIATAANRKKAFQIPADVYITNHDAVTWIVKNLSAEFIRKFSTLIVDESTAFKNSNAERSKALRKIAGVIPNRRLLTGTPNPNSVLELWHQAFLLDRGERLGDSYWRYRSQVCTPTQVGPHTSHVEWKDKEDIEPVVFGLLSDITIRHEFDKCISIPPNTQRTIEIELPPSLRIQYDDMLRHSRMLVDNDSVTASQAASLRNKLLQIASGAVYTGEESNYAILDNQRTELILDLVEERPHTLVAFQWRHQRDALIEEAKKRKLAYAVIDGSIHGQARNDAVANYQAGKLRVIFAHPQAAGHGLTLTKGVATIWASPTYNSEHYKQFFHRIYRAGQTSPTETIHIIAKNTIDEHVRQRRDAKLSAMQTLLDLMEAA